MTDAAATRRCGTADDFGRIAAHAENINQLLDNIRASSARMQRDINHLAALTLTVLDMLEHLTTDEFANGGDRPIRVLLAEGAHRMGRLSNDQQKEYLPT